MAKIFITGSADGLGQFAALQLMKLGHEVVLHARNAARAKDVLAKIPAAKHVLVADLSSLEECKKLAHDVNDLGKFDAVIHNAGVYRASQKQIFAVNSLAPYVLTCLIKKPERLVYLSSGMHLHGHADLGQLTSDGGCSYSDSKLHMVMLSLAAARRWQDTYSNAVDPGWVATKMGGAGAPDNLEKGYQTQTWLAISDDPGAKVSGHYFYHQRQKQHSPEADDVSSQQKFLILCEKITGVHFSG